MRKPVSLRARTTGPFAQTPTPLVLSLSFSFISVSEQEAFDFRLPFLSQTSQQPLERAIAVKTSIFRFQNHPVQIRIDDRLDFVCAPQPFA
jgi:hypothetical protein